MKKIMLWLPIFMIFSCSLQEVNNPDKVKVRNVVNQFFESLHTQDTILYKSTLFLEGQIWSIDNTTKSKNRSMRFFRDDLGVFDPEEIWEEIPLNFDINIHKGMAMAWVPYEFKVNGVFTHCGIDVFTLTETIEGWKIINAAYTKYTDGCDDWKN